VAVDEQVAARLAAPTRARILGVAADHRLRFEPKVLVDDRRMLALMPLAGVQEVAAHVL
jgi:hypothetical protein